MEIAIVIVALIGYLAFRHWLQANRRAMIHRERLAALEKGVDLPPLEHEIRKSSVNIQRFLLLAGLVWISLGIGIFVVLSALLVHPDAHTASKIKQGMQWIGVAPVCIGLSHVIVYAIGSRKKEN
jgi:small-conductance mechanosensitive channel